MNLLITGAWQGAKEHIPTLEQMGHQVQFLQWEKDALPCEPSWVEGIIGNGIFLSHPIEQFTNLRYIQLTSAGFDRVPMDYVKEKGIEIHNARGVYSIPMAEYALTGVLYLYKQMSFFHDNQKKHLWVKHRNLLELTDKTVVIAGCGSVGNECAKRFGAFGCKVQGIDLYPRKDALYEEIFPMEALIQALSQADILVMTLPLTEETRHLIDSQMLGKMKKSAIIVNMSRGAVINQQDLTEALQKGSIGGAVLDVFEEEPLDEASPLWDMENVIVTPHNSFVGEKNKERLNQVILTNLMRR